MKGYKIGILASLLLISCLFLAGCQNSIYVRTVRYWFDRNPSGNPNVAGVPFKYGGTIGLDCSACHHGEYISFLKGERQTLPAWKFKAGYSGDRPEHKLPLSRNEIKWD